jgi:ABC-type sugar transport system substrate-binding protein
MKKNILPILILAIIIIFTGCNTNATPESQIVTVTASEVHVPTQTETPIPTKTVVPTATAEPIPCTISFDTNRDGNLEIYRMSPDGSDTVNLTNNPKDDFKPSWSPDGRRIAFVSNRENDQGGGQFIYVMNADGSDVHQLTFENDSNWPDWSHDGSQVTYTSKGDIFIINADGSGEAVNLTNSPEEDSQSRWSPNDSQIAWLSGKDGKLNAFVMNADGSKELQVTDNGQVGRAEWTFDGRIITDWGWKDQKEFCHNCLVNADGSNIVDAGGKGEAEAYQPFTTVEGYKVGIANVNAFTGDNEIYLVGKIFPDPQGLGAGFINLTHNPADDRYPDWPANCTKGIEVVVPDAVPATAVPTEARPAAAATDILIGYAGDDPVQVQRKNNFQKACEELKIKCVYGEIPELISKGVKAIVQNSNPQAMEGLTPALMQAKEKGIPVFVLDAETNAEGVYSVTIDRRQWVNTSLEWMLKTIGGKGDFAYFDFQPNKDQAAIIEDTLMKYPGIHVVTQEIENYDFRQSKSYVSTLMNDFPDLKAIWANDSLSTIVLGMADTGIPSEDWPLLMCEPTKEGLYIWIDRLKDHPGMRCIAVSNPPGIAYDAVYAAYYQATGVQIDKSALSGQYGNSLYADMPIVTNDNLKESLVTIQNEDNKYIVDELMDPQKIKEKWFLE